MYLTLDGFQHRWRRGITARAFKKRENKETDIPQKETPEYIRTRIEKIRGNLNTKYITKTHMGTKQCISLKKTFSSKYNHKPKKTSRG